MFRFDLFFILVDDCNEVTDYAIARRIIDLHTKLEESVDRMYSEEEVLLLPFVQFKYCNSLDLILFLIDFGGSDSYDLTCKYVLSGFAVSAVCKDVQAQGGDGGTRAAGPAIQTPQAS